MANPAPDPNPALDPNQNDTSFGAPPLPSGRWITLPGRGELFIREAGVRRGHAPTLVLLHGWTATADLNFFPLYSALGANHHVVSFDLRGHGRGLRSPDGFRLSDCADDVAALAAALAVGSEADPPRLVVVGYSMGGLVAQLVWQRHRGLVAGLVLCSTSRNFRGAAGDVAYFSGLAALAAALRLAPGPVRERAFARFLERRRESLGLGPWGQAELAGHDVLQVAEAGAAIGTFSSHHWIGQVDVPCAVVVTTADTKIPPHRQRKLAAAIPGAAVFEVEGDHHACPRQPERFLGPFLAAVDHVLDQMDQAGRAPHPQ